MAEVGSTQFDPIPIGEVAKPPFVRLPDPSTMFARRTKRLRSLADTHQLRAYLAFVADLSDVQHRLQSAIPPPGPPSSADLARSRQFKMPPLDRSRFTRDAAFDALWDRLLAMVEQIAMPENANLALQRLRVSDAAAQAAMIAGVLNGTMPAAAPAEHAFVAAAAQVHFARLAAQLDATTLVPIGDGTCPACGSPPVCSMVVGWSGAENTRFCVCSLCATMWNYPRIKCVLCGSTEGIAYQEIAGGSAAVKAETCDSCRRYVKILQHHSNRSLDPVADDIATLALDLLLRQSEYRRGGANAFLLGY
jgi:FdhE protein